MLNSLLAQTASTGAERQNHLTSGWGAMSPHCTKYLGTVRRTEADLLRAQYLGFVEPNPMRHSPATTHRASEPMDNRALICATLLLIESCAEVPRFVGWSWLAVAGKTSMANVVVESYRWLAPAA
jgi:hypothetical protein